MSARTEVVGLIAGQGTLPILVAQGIRNSGRRVACIGLRDQFDPELPKYCDDFAVAGFLRLNRWVKLARRFNIQEAVMVGRVSKSKMHDPLRIFRSLPDLRAINLWYRRLRHDHRTPAILSALAEDLATSGVTLIDSTRYIPEHLATIGLMTRTAPDALQVSDTVFAHPLLLELLRLGIGQSISVRDKDTIAVEALEGTDQMIARSGALCKTKGWTLLKSAREDHDRRADVPTIGVSTIEALHTAGGRAIAVGAGKVILLDKPAVLAAADRLKISIVGI
ncbi:MAG: LpxI family protein [Planctomycetota bacterium]|nr:MAG: LpxI family protein [Planctomycetota bacterium]RLS92324.1 MAG: LpxI family protein [Planctomycetota bacterium]